MCRFELEVDGVRWCGQSEMDGRVRRWRERFEQEGNTREGLGGGEVAALEGALLGEELVAGNGELSPGVENFGGLGWWEEWGWSVCFWYKKVGRGGVLLVRDGLGVGLWRSTAEMAFRIGEEWRCCRRCKYLLSQWGVRPCRRGRPECWGNCFGFGQLGNNLKVLENFVRDELGSCCCHCEWLESL